MPQRPAPAPALQRWSRRSTPELVAGAYAVVGFLWIGTSDWVFRGAPTWVGASKGLLYVAVTAVILLWVLQRRERTIGQRDGALRTAAGRLSAVADTSADFTAIIDAEGRLAYLTDSVQDVLGWPAAAFTASFDQSFLHEDDLAPTIAVFTSVAAEPGSTRHFTARVRHADGGWRWLACVVVNRLDDPAVTGVVAQVRDVTAEREQTLVISSLLAGSARLAQASTEDEVARAALDACLAAVGASGGAVRRLDAGRGELVPLLVRNLDLAGAYSAFRLDGAAPLALAARAQRVVSLASRQEIAAFPAGTVPDDLAAVVYVPMLISSRTVGTIGLGFTAPRALSQAALDSLLTFAHAAALALERTRLDTSQRAALVAAEDAAARTDALHRITRTLSGSCQVVDVLGVALDALVEVLPAVSVTAVLRAGPDLVRVVAVRGEPGSAEPLTFRLDAERPICTVVRTGSDRWFEDRAQLTAAFGPAEPVPAYGHAAGIVPLTADDAGPVGAITVLFPEPAAVRAADRDFVTSVAMLCSEALRRIRLGEIERRAEARAAALHRVTESFSRSLTMDEVIATAVSAVIDAMAPATAGATVRIDGERYKQWAWDGTRAATLTERWIESGAATPVVAAVLADGRARFYESSADVVADLGAGTTHPFPLTAGAFIPLIIDDECVGLLGVTFVADRRFPESDRELLGGLAAVCAEAMRRARHFEQAHQAAARYEELFAGYEQLFQANPIPMVVYDDGLRVLATNEALDRAFGYDPADLAGSSVAELLAEPAQRDGGLERFFDGDEAASGRRPVQARRKDGSTFFMAVSSHDAAMFAGRPARVGLLVDQTARVQAEEANKALQARVVAVAEEERRRLAGDLHDGPVQQLAIASMRLSALRRRNPGEDAWRVQLDKVEGDVTATVDELRTMMQQLHPQGLEGVPLDEAIGAAVTQLPWTAGLSVRVAGSVRCDLPPTVQAALYRVAIEALQNVHKHAAATEVTIELLDDGDAVELRVTDDGVGIDDDATAQPGHLGLPSMRDRISLLGGACRVGRAGAAGGTVVTARLPLRAERAVTR
ncbi:MAG: GAF domain-containing protein [Acidimicrobiia bacterium]